VSQEEHGDVIGVLPGGPGAVEEAVDEVVQRKKRT
jgi:hypothetical protein